MNVEGAEFLHSWIRGFALEAAGAILENRALGALRPENCSFLPARESLKSIPELMTHSLNRPVPPRQSEIGEG